MYESFVMKYERKFILSDSFGCRIPTQSLVYVCFVISEIKQVERLTRSLCPHFVHSAINV